MADSKSGAARKNTARREEDDAENAGKQGAEKSPSASGRKQSKVVARESEGIKGFFGNIGKFLKSVKTEMGRVAWPSFKELRTATIVVILTLVIVAAYMGVVDWLLGMVFKTPQVSGF